ncbi:MAG: nucleoside hydrolase [Lachnospiraceae bacterium]|nr:nucleoside hydrolase [Lachnospiraceae bacterium]
MLKKRPFSFPQDQSIRVICDTDACNEADDQYCIAHLLMTPRFEVRGLIAAHYGTAKAPDSEQRSYEEIERVVALMGLNGEVNILHGAKGCLADEHTPQESEGARFIVEEAMREDPRPLFICCIGAITNLACAYLMEPRIAGKITVIWVGGGAYPKGEFEYNLYNDLAAANVVFRSDMELWQVPKPVYITMKVSYFELMNHVFPCGKLGKYLVENTMRIAEYEAKMMEDHTTPLGSRYLTMSRAAAATSFAGELWSLGDSPVVGLMINHTLGHFHAESPCGFCQDFTYDYSVPGSREIRVYDDIDNHFIVQDLFEKLNYYFCD